MHRETATYKVVVLKKQEKTAPRACTKPNSAYGGKGPAGVAEFAIVPMRDANHMSAM